MCGCMGLSNISHAAAAALHSAENESKTVSCYKQNAAKWHHQRFCDVSVSDRPPRKKGLKVCLNMQDENCKHLANTRHCLTISMATLLDSMLRSVQSTGEPLERLVCISRMDPKCFNFLLPCLSLHILWR